MICITKQIRETLIKLIEQQTLQSAIAIYQLLEEQGLSYAKLAKGIAKNSSFIGYVTNKYLQVIAKHKYRLVINNGLNADILLDDIKIAMAYKYANYVIGRYDQQRITTLTMKNISIEKIRELHTQVFAKFGLGCDVWILAIPCKLYDKLKHSLLKIYSITVTG